METIKFRGKKAVTGDWVYGSLISSNKGNHCIVQQSDESVWNDGQIKGWCFGVKRESVGQFTGLSDKNGKDIYKGDILKGSDGKLMIIGWSKKFASFVLNRDGWAFSHWFGESCNPEDCEVIGNIHDNPELLK